MTTIFEADRDGRPARVFHRSPTAAFTHPVDQPYSYRSTDRHRARGTANLRVELRCPCFPVHGNAPPQP